MHLFSICISSLEKSQFKSFAHFIIGLFVFLLLRCRSSLSVLDITPFRYVICKYFVPFCGLPFTLFIMSFDTVHFINFFFVVSAFGVIFKKLVPH